MRIAENSDTIAQECEQTATFYTITRVYFRGLVERVACSDRSNPLTLEKVEDQMVTLASVEEVNIISMSESDDSRKWCHMISADGEKIVIVEINKMN